MGYALVGMAGSTTQAVSTLYNPLGGKFANTITTESQANLKVKYAGTFSYLQGSVDATGTARVLTFRKGSADGNQSVSFTDSTAEIKADTTHTDTVASADLIDFKTIRTGSAPTWFFLSTLFRADSGHVVPHVTFNGATVAQTTGQTRYFSVGGRTAIQATESDAQVLARAAGDYTRLGVNVTANNATFNSTVTFRPNTAAGNQIFTISSGSGAGYFEDTTHTDTIASGDVIAVEIAAAGGGANTLTISQIANWFTASGGGTAADVFMGADNITRAASGTTHYTLPIGCPSATNSTTESTKRMVIGCAGTVSKFRFRATANTYTGTFTANLRKNGVTQITLSVTTGVTTMVEDGSTTFAVSAGDDMSISFSGGTANSISMGYFAYTFDAPGTQAVITGTATSSITETDIVSGGKTIIITLTGDTWQVAAGGLFDAQRQNIIDGIDSAQSEANGWDAEVKAKQGVAGVVRTSDTVVTITLDAQAAYNITATETITVTVPASALLLGLGALVGAPTFTVTATAGSGIVPIVDRQYRARWAA